jgi:hypothetical protein
VYVNYSTNVMYMYRKNSTRSIKAIRICYYSTNLTDFDKRVGLRREPADKALNFGRNLWTSRFHSGLFLTRHDSRPTFSLSLTVRSTLCNGRVCRVHVTALPSLQVQKRLRAYNSLCFLFHLSGSYVRSIQTITSLNVLVIPNEFLTTEI